MLKGFLFAALITFLAVSTHRRTRFEEKVFKNVPLNDWITFLFLPIGLYAVWSIIVRDLLLRTLTEYIPFSDFELIFISYFFIIFAFVGNTLHFHGKVLWRYLHKEDDSMAYKVNEMFHGKLSHYTAYLCGLIVIFLLSLLEINHPISYPVTVSYMSIIIVAGMVLGVSFSKAIFYTNEWFGGYNKPLFFIVGMLCLILVGIFKTFKLFILFYPYNIFVFAFFFSYLLRFLISQAKIFTRLQERKKLRFIARIFS